MQTSVDIIKKSFNIVKDSPFITLYFVIYLIVLFLIIPVMLTSKSVILTVTIGVLLLLLACAFAAGWFGMIRSAILLYKENKTPEQKLDETIKLKDSFFASVANYILPIIAGFLIFIGLVYLQTVLLNVVFGTDDVFYNISKYANDPEGLRAYFSSLPETTWIVILKKNLCSYMIFSFITLAMLFYSASLYLNNKCSLNPIRAIVGGIKTMISKPVETFIAFVFLAVINFVLMFLYALFIQNIIISFITMILRIYFIAYIVVLIFALYENKAYEENKPAIDCNNRPDSIG